MARDYDTGYDDEYDDRHGVEPLDEDDLDVPDEPEWIPCPACAGDGLVLGALGEVTWYRCRACGLDFRRGGR